MSRLRSPEPQWGLLRRALPIAFPQKLREKEVSR